MAPPESMKPCFSTGSEESHTIVLSASYTIGRNGSLYEVDFLGNQLEGQYEQSVTPTPIDRAEYAQGWVDNLDHPTARISTSTAGLNSNPTEDRHRSQNSHDVNMVDSLFFGKDGPPKLGTRRKNKSKKKHGNESVEDKDNNRTRRRKEENHYSVDDPEELGHSPLEKPHKKKHSSKNSSERAKR